MLKIGTKLGLGVGTLLAVSVIIGLVSYTQTRLVGDKIEEITKFKEPINSAVYTLENNLVETILTSLGYLSTGDPRLLAAFQRNKEEFEKSRLIYAAADPGKEAGTSREFARFRTVAERQLQLRDNQTKEMVALLGDLDAIDGLLTERIKGSITPDDPLAYKRLQAALEMEIHANAITKGLGNYLLTGQSRFESQVRLAESGFERAFQVYQNVLISADEKRWAAELRLRFNGSLRRARVIIELEDTRRDELAAFTDSYREFGSVLNSRLQQKTEGDLAVAKHDVLEAGNAANRRILVVLLVGVVFGVGAGYVTTRNITGPLKRLADVMHAVARGEHVQKIRMTSADEMRRLGDAFNLMIDRLLQANEELKQSELRFRTVFEDAPIGIALADADVRMIEANPALRDILGAGEQDFHGRPLGEVIGAEDQRAVPALLEDVGRGDRRQHAELKCRRAGDGTRWMNMNVSHMRDEMSGSSHFIVMIEDITDRRATEQEMRMLAQTITSMNESVVITDLQKSILSVNPAFLRTYGYEEGETAGMGVDALLAATGDDPRSDRPFSVAASGGSTGEFMHRKKNGERFPVLMSTSVVRDDQGNPIALVGIARDITEQKRLQHQLEEVEEQRSEGVRRFALSVQHAQESERKRISRELHDDLCQRLSGMKFRVEVLEDEVGPEQKKVGRQLREFRHELDRAISEVRRISSNLRPSVLDDFGLVTALRLLCKDFERLHAIRASFILSAGATLHLDPNTEIAVYRIVQEALSNVARHAGASQANVRLVQRQAFIELVIQDDGRGFDQRTLDAKDAGHGFGLMNMRERAELLGGTCEIDSETDKGTCVSVTLPSGDEGNHEQDQNTDR